MSVVETRTEKWKQKAKKLKASEAQLERELDAKEKELETLQKKIDEQRQEIANLTTFRDVPAYHKYSLGQIMLFIDLVLSAATTFRGASRAMQITYTSLGLNLKAPSWVAGRLWVLRLGSKARAKELSNDWVWIVDHTIQLGTKKCLVIVGIRLASLPPVGNCLSHKDVEPIALLPVTRSNGDIVYKQLEECVVKTGIPRQIVADYGSDVKSGVEKFCSVHKETSFIWEYDIKHKTAALLKKILKNDEAWAAFTRLASQSKKSVQQTLFAPLAPPNQRTKARYMNVDILINWGLKMLNLIDNPTQLMSNEFDPKQVDIKLGWVSKFRAHRLVGRPYCNWSLSQKALLEKKESWLIVSLSYRIFLMV